MSSRRDEVGACPPDCGVVVDEPRRLAGLSEREFILLLAALSATTAVGIDIVLPAYDAIEADLDGAASGQLSRLVTVYFLGLSFAQVLFGPLSDRFGRKPILVVTVGAYLVGALISAMAPSFGWLLVGRLFWGIGAAGPRGLTTAISRDVAEGDALARLMTATTAVFMVAPALGPLIGEGVLALGDWRWVLASPAVFAAVLLVWSRRLDETLLETDRRPLGFGPTWEGTKTVFRTRETLGHGLAAGFEFGAFAVFLGSGAIIFDEIYDRDGIFAISFSAMSVLMGVASATSARFMGRVGARRMIDGAFVGALLTSVALLIWAVLADGVPPFWGWLALVVAANAMFTIVSPLLLSQAMTPMGDMAGTAGSILGVLMMGLGSILGSVIDANIDTTITPMVTGYVVYCLVAMALVRWARGGSVT